jgi:hypothetical protein
MLMAIFRHNCAVALDDVVDMLVWMPVERSMAAGFKSKHAETECRRTIVFRDGYLLADSRGALHFWNLLLSLIESRYFHENNLLLTNGIFSLHHTMPNLKVAEPASVVSTVQLKLEGIKSLHVDADESP